MRCKHLLIFATLLASCNTIVNNSSSSSSYHNKTCPVATNIDKYYINCILEREIEHHNNDITYDSIKYLKIEFCVDFGDKCVGMYSFRPYGYDYGMASENAFCGADVMFVLPDHSYLPFLFLGDRLIEWERVVVDQMTGYGYEANILSAAEIEVVRKTDFEYNISC